MNNPSLVSPRLNSRSPPGKPSPPGRLTGTVLAAAATTTTPTKSTLMRSAAPVAPATPPPAGSLASSTVGGVIPTNSNSNANAKPPPCGNRQCDSYVLWREELDKTSKLVQANEMLKSALQEALEKHREIAVEYAAKFSDSQPGRQAEEEKWKEALKNAALHMQTLNETIQKKDERISKLEASLEDHSGLVTTMELQNGDLMDKVEKLMDQLEMAQGKVQLAEKKMELYANRKSHHQQKSQQPHQSISYSGSASRSSTPTGGAQPIPPDSQNNNANSSSSKSAALALLRAAHRARGNTPPPETTIQAGASPAPSATKDAEQLQVSATTAPLGSTRETSSNPYEERQVLEDPTTSLATLASLKPMMEMVHQLETISNTNRYFTNLLVPGGNEKTRDYFGGDGGYSLGGGGHERGSLNRQAASPNRFTKPGEAGGAGDDPSNPPEQYLQQFSSPSSHMRWGKASHVDIALPTIRLMCAVFPSHTQTLSVLRDVYLDQRDEDHYEVLVRGQMVYDKCHSLGSPEEMEKTLDGIQKRSEQMSQHADYFSQIAREAGGTGRPTSHYVGTGVVPAAGSTQGQLRVLEERLYQIEHNNSDLRQKVVHQIEEEEIAANTAQLNAEYWQRQAEASSERRKERKHLQDRVAANKAANPSGGAVGGGGVTSVTVPASSASDMQPPPPLPPGGYNQYDIPHIDGQGHPLNVQAFLLCQQQPAE